MKWVIVAANRIWAGEPGQCWEDPKESQVPPVSGLINSGGLPLAGGWQGDKLSCTGYIAVEDNLCMMYVHEEPAEI